MVVQNSKCVWIYQQVHDRSFEVFIDIRPTSVPDRYENATEFRSALLQYFTRAFESSVTVVASKLSLWVSKGAYPKSYFVQVHFTGSARYVPFPDVTKFIAKSYRGPRVIKNQFLSTSVDMRVTDSIIIEKTIAKNINTSQEYEKAKTSNVKARMFSSLNTNMRLHKCDFCYRVELLADEKGYDRRGMYIRQSQTVLGKSYSKIRSNGTGVLTCADDVNIYLTRQTANVRQPQDDTVNQEAIPAPEKDDNKIDDFAMLVAWVSLGLVLCFVVSVKTYLRRLLVRTVNTNED